MQINQIQDFKLKDIVLISSLPDMGRVGGLVTQYLTKKLAVKNAVQIILADKPWINLKEGVIDLPHDEYTISVDEKNSIVIFTGENQPQEPGTVFEIADKVLDVVSQMGNIKIVISTGGYLPMEVDKADKVYGVATTSTSINFLKSFGIPILSSDVKSITWFNGLILGLAKARKINAIGLFGEILDSELPQYKTASNIINLIAKILQTKIDTKELDDKKDDAPAETKKERPGIG